MTESRKWRTWASFAESDQQQAAAEADHLANLGPDLFCTLDGSDEDVVPVRITTAPGDRIAFARIMELCGACRAAIEGGDDAAIAQRLADHCYEAELPDAVRVLRLRYAGPVVVD